MLLGGSNSLSLLFFLSRPKTTYFPCTSFYGLGWFISCLGLCGFWSHSFVKILINLIDCWMRSLQEILTLLFPSPVFEWHCSAHTPSLRWFPLDPLTSAHFLYSGLLTRICFVTIPDVRNSVTFRNCMKMGMILLKESTAHSAFFSLNFASTQR